MLFALKGSVASFPVGDCNQFRLLESFILDFITDYFLDLIIICMDCGLVRRVIPF